MFKTILISALLITSIVSEDPQLDDVKLQQQELSMKRTACLVLSRYHSNTQKDTLQQLISGLQPQLQQKFINKMYASAIEHCLPHITMDDAQKFFVEDPNFNPEEMFHYYEKFDYSGIDPSVKLTKNQQNLVKFIKNFDQEMQVRKEQRQAKKDQDTTSDSEFNMKFFGLSTSDIPSSAKYAYIVLFAAIVGGSIYYLMSKLDNKTDKNVAKKKKGSASPAKNTPSSPKAAAKRQ